jgi:hypothetical protein
MGLLGHKNPVSRILYEYKHRCTCNGYSSEWICNEKHTHIHIQTTTKGLIFKIRVHQILFQPPPLSIEHMESRSALTTY